LEQHADRVPVPEKHDATSQVPQQQRRHGERDAQVFESEQQQRRLGLSDGF
jgi:hypothetical protein